MRTFEQMPATVFMSNPRVMDVLFDLLKQGGKEISKLVNLLPTGSSILNQLRAIPLKNHIDYSGIFQPELFGYVLKAVEEVEKQDAILEGARFFSFCWIPCRMQIIPCWCIASLDIWSNT
jgi:hypothetical protein